MRRLLRLFFNSRGSICNGNHRKVASTALLCAASYFLLERLRQQRLWRWHYPKLFWLSAVWPDCVGGCLPIRLRIWSLRNLCALVVHKLANLNIRLFRLNSFLGKSMLRCVLPRNSSSDAASHLDYSKHGVRRGKLASLQAVHGRCYQVAKFRIDSITGITWEPKLTMLFSQWATKLTLFATTI